MKINIYYGGRGLFDDPTLFVLGLMEKVFKELGVTTELFRLYELKNRISTMPQTLKDADGIILASTVEWFGVGGYMQQFLDACYLYGDKEKISQTYMCPVVMSTTYGEREGELHLSSAWEILGGLPCSGLCGYISDMADLEMNKNYHAIIEKKAEDAYRAMSRHSQCLPASNQAVRQKIAQVRNFRYTPKENEVIAEYASDEEYVKEKKATIQELTGMYRSLMDSPGEEKTPEPAPVKEEVPEPMEKAPEKPKKLSGESLAALYQKSSAVPNEGRRPSAENNNKVSKPNPSAGRKAALPASAEKLEKNLQEVYMPISGFKTMVRMSIDEEGIYDIHLSSMGCSLSQEDETKIPNVEIRMEREALDKILAGQVTFLKAFMIGEIKMTGDFQVLRTLDQLFVFKK